MPYFVSSIRKTTLNNKAMKTYNKDLALNLIAEMAQPNNEESILSEMNDMIENGYSESMNLKQLVKRAIDDLDLAKEEVLPSFDNTASNWLAEKNKENARKSLPSSLR